MRIDTDWPLVVGVPEPDLMHSTCLMAEVRACACVRVLARDDLYVLVLRRPAGKALRI